MAPTLPITGRVRTLHDGTYEETERRHGGARYGDAGLSAVVEVNRSAPGKGGLLVLNSKRTPPMSIHQLTSVGIVPQQQKILVAKGTVAPPRRLCARQRRHHHRRFGWCM